MSIQVVLSYALSVSVMFSQVVYAGPKVSVAASKPGAAPASKSTGKTAPKKINSVLAALQGEASGNSDTLHIGGDGINTTTIGTTGPDEDDGVIIDLPEIKDKPKPDTLPKNGDEKEEEQKPRTPEDALIIKGTDRSMVPNVSCALVDDRPHTDLVNATQNLYDNMNALRACKSDVDVTALIEGLNTIIASGKNLRDLKWDPDTLKEKTDTLATMQTDVQTVITGIDRISTLLMNNKLLNSECANGAMKSSDIVAALSDLIQATSPYALAVATANPGFAPAIPFIMGISGMGSVARVIKNINDKNTIDINDPKMRQAVLLNLCEYSRIESRVKIFKRAKSGDVRTATEEMDKYSVMKRDLLRYFPDDVSSIAVLRAKLNADLDNSEKALQDDTVEIKKLKSQMDGDITLACYITRRMVTQATDTQVFPGRTLATFKKIINRQKQPSISQLALIDAELSIRDNIRNDNAPVTPGTVAYECADRGRSYLGALSAIVDASLKSVQATKSQLEEFVKTDKDFAEYLAAEANLRAEIQRVDVLAKSGSVFSSLNSDNGVLDIREIDEQMVDIKRALFEPRNNFRLMGGSMSPALAWLDHSREQAGMAQANFAREYSQLEKEIYNYHTESGKGLQKPATGKRKSPNEEVEQLKKDIKDSHDLKPLSMELIGDKSEVHRKTCQRLEDIWFTWYTVVNNLAAEDLVCSSISPYLQTGSYIEPNLKSFCVGINDLAGKSLKRSEFADLKKQMVKLSGREALNINDKYDELKCQQFETTDL